MQNLACQIVLTDYEKLEFSFLYVATEFKYGSTNEYITSCVLRIQS